MHGAHTDRAAVDHDLRAVDAPSPAEDGARPAAPDDDDILRFPRGPAAGECIHQVFERAAFDDAATWPDAVARAVRRMRAMGVEDEREPRGAPVAVPASPADARAAADARHGRRLHRMLADVLATPLPLATPTPLRLQALPSSRRLVELEFHLPSHRLDARALGETLAALGVDVPPLAFAPLQGFLKGFIDLVFEHEGRWYVLDWKSNHLGDSAAAYGRDAMAAVMRDQGYRLQALLYLVALDRHLRRRVPGYRTERHLGGAVYLFVRGVRPGWRDAAGAPAGVFLERPPAAAIRRLSALFDAPGGDAGEVSR
jgi:exodeoxyribonuclease V beta subunit